MYQEHGQDLIAKSKTDESLYPDGSTSLRVTLNGQRSPGFINNARVSSTGLFDI